MTNVEARREPPLSSKIMPVLAIALALAVVGFDVAMSVSSADAGLYRQSMSP